MSCPRVALFILVLFAGPLWALKGQEPEPRGFRVAGYLPDYRASEFDVSAVRCLTDLIVFSGEPQENGELGVDRLTHVPWGTFREYRQKTGVRLILCIGGWERSTHFARICDSDELRSRFVKSIIAFIERQKLNGVDLDWEHPRDAREQEGYARLLADLRAAFDPKGWKLSVTMAGWQKLPMSAFASVHWVQIMAYDHPEKHATFEFAEADMTKLIELGVPPEKITLGLPFYGRGVQDRQRTQTYRQIHAEHPLDPGVNEVDGLYFNGPELIRRKTALAIERGLAGVMIWELGQDATGEDALMKVICDMK